MTTRFLYDGADLVAEYDGSNAVQRRYVHGPGVDDAVVWYEGSAIDNSTRRFLMSDERGSVVSVTDSAGATVGLNSYDEYGIPAPGNLGRFGYTGQAWLPELGMWYYKARIYAPVLGRFMQSDPIGYRDGMNWYDYVGSDPVNGSDPTGLERGISEGGGPKPKDPTYFQGAGGGDARPDDIVVNAIGCYACESALTFLEEIRIIDLAGSLPRPEFRLEPNEPTREGENTHSDNACKSVAPLLANPAVQSTMSYADEERSRTGAEWAFFAGKTLNGRVGITPLFGGEHRSYIASSTVTWAYNQAVYQSRLDPQMMYHPHLGNTPPSPVGNGDAATAARLGLVVVARDRSGNITCTDGKK